MTQYVATVNTPGYLPQDDDVHVFDNPWEAWSYLADERTRGEDDLDDEGTEYSDTRETLAVLSTDAHWRHSDRSSWLASHGLTPDGTGTVNGDTPGYDGRHDLGLAYSVEVYTGPPIEDE